MATKTQYECQTRLNGRGGWEVSEIDAPAGAGIGNYATEADAFAFARYNFDASRIKRGEEPMVLRSTPHTAAAKKRPFFARIKKASAAPVLPPLTRRVKALTK